MDKYSIVDEIWEKICAVTGISPETGRTSHDDLFYLRIFKRAQQAGLNIEGDALIDGLYARYQDKMNDVHRKVIHEIAQSWREWAFLMKNYERV